MREYYELGPVPSEEDCLQTGKDDFSLMSDLTGSILSTIFCSNRLICNDVS